MTVGERIRNRRKELGLSQTKLGERIGVSKAVVSSVECGHEDLTTDRLDRYADALNTTSYDLLGWNDPEAEFKRTEDKEKIAKLVDVVQMLSDEQLDNVLHYAEFLKGGG